MKCENCGKQIESGQLYCPTCGHSIQLVPNYNVLEEELLSKVVEDKTSTKDNFQEGVYKAKNEAIENEINEQAPAKSTNLPKKKLTFKLMFILLALLCVLIIVVFYKYTHTFHYRYNAALNAEENGQYKTALTYYEDCLIIDETSVSAKIGMARSYYELKDYDSCISNLMDIIEENSDNEEVFELLIKSYQANNETDAIYDLIDLTESSDIIDLINNYIIIPPQFNVNGGEYNDYVTLFLTSSDDNQIFYTLDGKDPTKSGKVYKDSIVIKEGTTTVKAVSKNKEGKYSKVVSEEYVINYNTPTAPVVSPAAGVYTTPTTITIDVPSNADAYYTWDASVPTESSFQYTGPFDLVQGKHILSVIIIDNHGNKSALFQGEYSYTPE